MSDFPTPDTFFALRPGPAAGTGAADGPDLHLTVHDLGDLVLPSGRLEASDPFARLGDGLVVRVEPGRYPVRVTVADVSDEQDGSHLREAYLSVVLAEGEVAVVEPVVPEGADVPPEAGTAYGVPVDAGTVAFADADAVARLMPEGDWYEEVFDDGTDTSWFSLMDSAEHLFEGVANIELPGAPDGENVVLAHSGWGDGFYPLVRTVAADGTVLGLHLDLLVALPDDED
ncbi:DUF4241 domain-containing protein [Cellulosimicrobium cellulans]|uniref:DUF4241 domain-containing protein n=1 Tax=Cellulosimicrobium cellulans TaxID=1710 RepID=UPI001966C8DB|nr:DUF4241 domain-containing protein [Cellulosimicrobium cellulans]MBN0041611.1 DUF4241 domain-containing protein [Cellulosimicrobium cellulans]